MHAVRRTVVVATLLVLLGLVAGFDVSVDNNEERSRGSALAPTATEYAVMLGLVMGRSSDRAGAGLLATERGLVYRIFHDRDRYARFPW